MQPDRSLEVSVELGPIGWNWRDIPLSHEVDLARHVVPIHDDALFPIGAKCGRGGTGGCADDTPRRLGVAGDRNASVRTGACVAAARSRGITDCELFTVYLPAGPPSIEIHGAMAIMAGPCRLLLTGLSRPKRSTTSIAVGSIQKWARYAEIRNPLSSRRTHPAGSKPTSTASPSRATDPLSRVLARIVVPPPISIS